MALTMSRLEVYLCLLNGVVEDRRFLRLVSEAITVSHGSYLTTFVKGPPSRNGSKYVKNGDFLMPFKWSCGGQEVPDDGLWRFLSGSTGPEDGSRLLQTSKRPLLG